jgi:ADP-heptose:LPS heptosyltransferase
VFLSSLLENSDYFVVSTDFLEFSHERFRNLNSHSRQSIDDFAAIIANVDAVISVDTLTYHLADAFDIPTVVLFTTIEPKYRILYYPFTEAIMLENQDGYLYGKHKGTLNPEKIRDEILYMDKKWAAVNVSEVLQLLEKAKSKKLSYK